jgi:hypothetical protein
MAVPFWMAVTLLEYGEWLGEGGREEEAAPPFAEAQENFERLEARPWLERLIRSHALGLREDLPALGGIRRSMDRAIGRR